MKSHAREDAKTRFLNVDLELVTTAAIDSLLTEWGDLVMLRDSVDDGIRTIWIELGEDHPDLDTTVNAFLALVESLSPSLRKRWDSCRDRCFNVGIQAETKPHSSAFSIASNTLQRMGALNARVEFTVYGGSSSPDKGR